MISFACGQCNKQLKVKDELAGKTGKCPGCGQPVVVPALAAAASISPVPSPDLANRKAPPPSISPGTEERTLPPKNPDQSGKESLIAGGETALGADAVPVGEPNSDLWDFLAPAQKPDEIGRLGPYRVLKVLGAGGMGVVFRAEDPQLERLVALKAMLPTMAKSPNAKERFFREAKAAAALKHPHIVTIFQVGEDRGAPYLAMEFLEGEALDDRLKREIRLPVPDILRIGREIAQGLAAAHEKGLIHRDIKPANVWLEGKEGHVKILDFGLARAMGDQAQLTQSGAIIGTPAYMAPEQAGGKQVDGRCDLFSLGCVLYRMCTGEMPFKGNDTISILSALALENPPQPVSLNPEIPTELSDLVMQLLAKKPDERPKSAKVVAEALTALEKPTNSGMPEVVYVPGATAVVDDPFANIDASGDENPALTRASPRRKSTEQTIATPANPARKSGADSAPSAHPTGSIKKPRSRRLIFAGLAGVLALVAAFVIIKMTNKDGTVTESKVPDGAKVERVEKGKTTVVDPNPKKEPIANSAALPATFKNNLGMEFVLVPKGKFLMGGSGGTPGNKEAVIAHDFYLGKYEITQEEWQKVTGVNPSHFSRTGGGKDAVKGIPDEELKRFPVENVSWDTAQLFLEALNEREKEAGWLYRLPKAAEWEYACRGGPTSNKFDYSYDFYFDKPANQLLPEQANFTPQPGKGLQRTYKVGSYQPNRLGLYDMHGNVWEWCDDLWDPKEKDPARVTLRVYRGGGWGGGWRNDAGYCRAAHRSPDTPSYRHNSLGLRLARVPIGKEVVAKQPEKPTEPKKVDPPAFVPPTFEEKEAKKQQEEWAAKLKLPVESTNKIGMKVILIPPAGNLIPQAYYLGKYEVTQGEWEKVMGYNPSGFGPKNPKVAGMDTSKFPVETVTWFDSVEFCNKLSEQEGLKPYYDLKVTKRGGKDSKQIDQAEVKILGGVGYHIPTDAEWTWGCAAGTKTTFHFGDKDNDLPEYAWFKDKSGGRTHGVGEKRPNAFGLYDMHGNVMEWNEEMLTKAGTEAPERVSRGGSWFAVAGHCWVSGPNRAGPAFRDSLHGLRLARVP